MGEGVRRRIVRRFLESSHDWVCRIVIGTNETDDGCSFSLSAFAVGFGAITSKPSGDGGDKVRMRAGVFHNLITARR
jgi:hypothetical protein